jgi:hypothetical protein
VCVYQAPPSGSSLQSLAWLVASLGAAGSLTSTVTLGWNMNYGFMFCGQSPASNGVSAEIVPADAALTTQNEITLAATTGGYVFQTPATAGPTAGTLTINETSQLLIGFSLAGTPLFGSAPATSTVTLTPGLPTALSYDIAFSPSPTGFIAGQVLPSPVPGAFTFTFPTNVFSQIATLTTSTTEPWTVVPTPPQ